LKEFCDETILILIITIQFQNIVWIKKPINHWAQNEFTPQLQVLHIRHMYVDGLPTGCTPCECSLAGSKNPVCNKTTGQCPCKEHSLGRQCNKCSPGYGVLSVNNSEGCLKCQCSNKLPSCVSDPGWFVSQITTELLVYSPSANFDGWTAINSAGDPVTLMLDWIVTINIEK